MVIMAPNNITLFIVFVYNSSKHLICFLICFKLRLETPGGSKAVFLWKSKVMKKGPQNVVAIAIVILMNNLFIKKYRNTPLQHRYAIKTSTAIFINYLPHFLPKIAIHRGNNIGEHVAY